jgi:hypothetical protein
MLWWPELNGFMPHQRSAKESTMPLDDNQATQFLLELYRMTQGDGSVKVSTEDVGNAIGLDKETAGKMSENLIGGGWVEIKTLSGGIGITAEGVEAARAAGGLGPEAATALSLGKGPVLDTNSRAAVEALADEIKQHVSTAATPYSELEEMVIDLKTLEIQMCSPQPKTAIIREIFRSLEAVLKKTGATQTAQRVTGLVDQA